MVKNTLHHGLPYANEMIHDKGCGIVVNNFSTLPNQLIKLDNNNNLMSANCFKSYKQLEFTNNFDKIYKLL